MTAASCCAADARGAADGGAQHKRESAPTLDALAARSASYSPAAAGGSGAAAPPVGDPLADLTRLGEQLAAMGGGGGGGEGGVLHSLHPPCTDIVPCICRYHAGGPCRRRRRGAFRGLDCGHTASLECQLQRLSAAIVGGALGSVPCCLYPPQPPQAAACSGRAQRAEHQHADSDCAGSAVSAWQAARSGSGVLASLPPRGLAVQCSAKGVAGVLSKP